MTKTRVAVVVTTLGLWFGAVAGVAWGQSADPLGLIGEAALMPYFNRTPGNLFFLLVASAVDDNPSLHLNFYSTTCSVGDSKFLPMTVNDTTVVAVDGTATVFEEGAILVFNATNPIVVRGVWFDVAQNRVRLVDPAGARVVAGHAPGFVPDEVWSPYDTGAVIPLAPPDDGGTFTESVIFSCPGGQLASDMNTIEPFSGPTPVTLHAVVYDVDEHPVSNWLHTCRCVGLNIPLGSGTWVTNVRLSQISGVYSTAATYTEIRGNGPFTGYWSVRFIDGASLDTEFFGRLHHGPFTAFQ
jgi:hypothetical protein